MKLTHKNVQKVFKLKDQQTRQYFISDEAPDGVFMSQEGYKIAMAKYPDAKYVVEEYELQLIGDDVPSILACIENMISQLNQIFDSDIMGWHSINYKPYSAWYLYDQSEVGWTDLDDVPDGDEHIPFGTFLEQYKNDEVEDMYSFEIYGSSIWYADGFTAFVGDNGQGDRDIYIFRKDLQLKWDE